MDFIVLAWKIGSLQSFLHNSRLGSCYSWGQKDIECLERVGVVVQCPGKFAAPSSFGLIVSICSQICQRDKRP